MFQSSVTSLAQPGNRPALRVIRGGKSQGSPQEAPQVIEVKFEVHPATAPALRSVVEEMSSLIATRMESKADYNVEDAWVRACTALGKLRAAVNAAISKEDPDYRAGRVK